MKEWSSWLTVTYSDQACARLEACAWQFAAEKDFGSCLLHRFRQADQQLVATMHVLEGCQHMLYPEVFTAWLAQKITKLLKELKDICQAQQRLSAPSCIGAHCTETCHLQGLPLLRRTVYDAVLCRVHALVDRAM